jgi:3-deoxy-7-phosphoheptulonate synthase
MRVYFEKPRTIVGWKGLINDPDLNNSYDVNRGLKLARQLLLDIAETGLPAGTEYLDPITPQYVSDLISWGAIGARTTESQVHRELASALSCPVGFKNSTDGAIQVAVDAVNSAGHPHSFLSVTKEGHSAIFSTAGNSDCHVILRGGGGKPNFDAAHVAATTAKLQNAGLKRGVMIDFSHANSQKDPERQHLVCEDVCHQLRQGSRNLCGVMIESHLVAGRQDAKPGQPLTFGQSITDACVGWEGTETMLQQLADAVEARRASGAA